MIGMTMTASQLAGAREWIEDTWDAPEMTDTDVERFVARKYSGGVAEFVRSDYCEPADFATRLREERERREEGERYRASLGAARDPEGELEPNPVPPFVTGQVVSVYQDHVFQYAGTVVRYRADRDLWVVREPDFGTTCDYLASQLRPASCSECGHLLTVSATSGTPGMPVYDALDGSECPSGVGHIPHG